MWLKIDAYTDPGKHETGDATKKMCEQEDFTFMHMHVGDLK